MTANEINTNEKTIPGTAVKMVLMSEHGYEMAGLNKGDEVALGNFLNSIKEGHLVDVSYSEKDQRKQQDAILSEIAEKDDEISKNRAEAKNILEVRIPSLEETIEEKKEEIHQTEKEKIEGRLFSDYSRPKHVLYTTLMVLLGIYLVMFYASAINSAFFRNLLSDLGNSGSENISLMINSVFDPYAIFTFRPTTPFIYFGSTLFFVAGILAHRFVSKQKSMKRKLLVGIVAFSIPLVADLLIAYKIHLNIIEAKYLMGMEDHTPWYQDVNFWLVVVFGYLGYVAWSLIFDASLEELAKKNPTLVADHTIIKLKKEVMELRREIDAARITLNSINSFHEKLLQERKTLHGQLGKILQDPNVLYRNLHHFYDGWLRYLNGTNKHHERKVQCEEKFRRFLLENRETANFVQTLN